MFAAGPPTVPTAATGAVLVPSVAIPAPPPGRRPLIFITAKFRVKPEHADAWIAISADFTAATRAEPRCRWFEWSRSVDDPTEYVLVEAFDDDAAEAHVTSRHFRAAQRELPQHLVETPRIVSTQVDQDDWAVLGEMAVED